MKTLLSLLGGALLVTEEAGVVTLSFDEALGGGAAAGVLKGSGSLVLNGEQGLQLGVNLMNAHLPPALLPLAQVVEGVALQALKAAE